ncbi:hypothetical protein DCAR_0416551 [Daucus carota subsp. sativus]|uniref:C2 domain-containing protein n=2 Tax=Daucus carota subsp. sativus TaxID=79200 RepID=A0AAF0WYA3_DAUCS|nr:hypothetical protein DCAR_0416551 [Daucus carota subsp. sativus]
MIDFLQIAGLETGRVLKCSLGKLAKFPAPVLRMLESSSTQENRKSDGSTSLDDPDGIISRVAKLVEQLHANKSSPLEKELITTRLLGITKARKEARTLIGSHAQAMPLFISILRSGTPVSKVNVATILSILCKDEDMRLKVLLGGCVPPLLSLLKSESFEARKAAAEAIYVVSAVALLDDHVGTKIFTIEGVVPALWEQLKPCNKTDKVVEGFVTGALRNLCSDKDVFWRATLEAGGVNVIVGLLSSSNDVAQSNAASLLSRLLIAYSDSIPKIIDSGVIRALLRLLGKENNISARASAADALEVITLKSTEAKKAVIDEEGVPLLIRAVVAPSKECMQGEGAQVLQVRAAQALANACGGISSLILYLGELCQSPGSAAPIADIIGTLAYLLMIYEQKYDTEEDSFDPKKIENILTLLLKPLDNKLVRECVLEAMASLYENTFLSRTIEQPHSKRLLIGLITNAVDDIQDSLILSLISICCDGIDIWEAIGKRDGIQLLVSQLGLSSEQNQEYAVGMLAVLSDQVDESKWAITAAGGIPPLVQLLELGSEKAREDSAHILWNLCCHSEDICECVESAGAISSFLWVLKNGGPGGQEASAKALTKIIRVADSPTINQLLALLQEEPPNSKVYVIKVLGHVLAMASQRDLVDKEAAANKGLRSLVQVLHSSDEETQGYAASVLADLFSSRQDICNTLAMDEVVNPCMKLLNSKTHFIAAESARTLGRLIRPIKAKSRNKMFPIAEGNVKPLIKLAKNSFIAAAETAVAALANLLSDPQIAAAALAEDVVSALIRVLINGSLEGKKSASRALLQLLRHFPVCDVLKDSAQCRSTVLEIVSSLKEMDMKLNEAAESLEVVALIFRTKQSGNLGFPPWTALAEVPSNLDPLVRCLADGRSSVQDKAIEILSRLCADHPALLGNSLVANSRSIASLAKRIIKSTCLEVRVGGTALLISAAKERKSNTIDALFASGYLMPFVYALVEMTRRNSGCHSLEIEVATPRGSTEKPPFQEADDFEIPDPAIILGGTAALWLLSIISSYHVKNKKLVVEAGGLEALSEKLAHYTASPQAASEDSEGIWISALLMATLFQDASVVSSPATLHIIPSLSVLLESDEVIDKYFAAQAIASIVCNGDKVSKLAVANSGVIVRLINMIGFVELDMPNLVALSEEFSLVLNPDQVVLNCIFELEDVRAGSTARKTIPLLVDLLRPMPDRPGASQFSIHLMTRIAEGSDANKLLMAEAGALDALTKYLSLSPQDSVESMLSELLRILFSNHEILRYEAAISSGNELIAVLRFGSRSSRFSAARALNELLNAENIRNSELAVHAVQPLIDLLNVGLESEQHVALLSLIKLTSGDSSRSALLSCVEVNALETLYRILSSNSATEFKTNAAELCFVLFGSSSIRAMPIASKCMEPLILLMRSDIDTAVEAGVCALERLLDDEHNVELAAGCDLLDLLVSLVSGSNSRLIEASISVLIRLGKDKTPCKLDIVEAGVIENCLLLVPSAPSSLCSTIAELFRILTNCSTIAKSTSAAKIVKPLFILLLRPDFSLWGQHSALQALVNILEKPQSLDILKLTPSEVIEPLLSFLESPSQAIQQLGTELLSHLLAQEHFQQDITTKNAIIPLVHLAGTGILNLQETAIKALENLSLIWPKALAEAGGILQLAKVIIQDDPQPSHALWESAASVLSNLLNFDADYYSRVPLVVLVKMLLSSSDSTVSMALRALVFSEKNEPSSGELMAEAGAVDALVDLLRSHRCEDTSGRLLEALFNNVRIREMKVCKYAVAPLAQYLLDPQTRSQSGRLLVALALGDLSQHEALARGSDAVCACRALVNLLEDQITDELKMVAICALQNFVTHSRTNRRAVAEAGGLLVIQEMLLAPSPDVAAQAAVLINILFSSHTLQEYVSNELIRSLTAALEKELWSVATINIQILKTINVIFSNFPKLHVSEAATLCIPHLIAALKSGSEVAQDYALNSLCLLKDSWSSMSVDVSNSQATVAAEAIPVLQMLLKTSPPSLHERADNLLHSLPGCLTVTIERANNLRQILGGTNAFCRLMIGNGPPQQTKIIYNSTSPQWNQGFMWSFDVPPRGQKLQIVCKSRSTFVKTTLGRLMIQIDRVVSEGVYSGSFSLSHGSHKERSSRTLEISITWSNGMPADNELD